MITENAKICYESIMNMMMYNANTSTDLINSGN